MIHRPGMRRFARNVSVESAKEGAVKTFMGFLLIAGAGVATALSGSGPIDAATEQSVAAQAGQSEETQFPIYKPPKKLTPRARVGGALRGTDGGELDIQALVPDHVALTIKKAPALNWFISKPTTYEIQFILVDSRAIKPLYEAPLPPPKGPGIYTIDFDKLGLALEPDVQYRWYVSVRRDPTSHAADMVVGGVIERCEFNACMKEHDPDLSCSQQSVYNNAIKGFWYDAMSCLCSLIDASPSDINLRRQRAALLRQVGLHGVAAWDLQSIQSALR